MEAVLVIVREVPDPLAVEELGGGRSDHRRHQHHHKNQDVRFQLKEITFRH